MSKTLLKKGQVQRGLKPNLKEAPVEVTTETDSLLDEVEKDLESKGIVPFGNENVWDEYLQLPADLTEEESKELGRYFNAFTQQKMYCRTLLGRNGALLRELVEELDTIKDRVFSELPAKMSVTEKNLKLRSHEIYGERASELLRDVAVHQERQNMLEIYLDNLVDAIFNISREISRRSGDFNDDRRENNIHGKR